MKKNGGTIGSIGPCLVAFSGDDDDPFMGISVESRVHIFKQSSMLRGWVDVPFGFLQDQLK